MTDLFLKRAWILVVLLALVTGRSSAASLTVDAAQTHQTIAGYGVNVNAGWWNNGEVKPALDLLVDQLGATLFRAVIEEMDWEAINDNSDPNVFNWTYYDSVYSDARFQGVWNTLRYLNQKGIVNGLVISFMGQPPAWMGGNSSVSTANEDEFVETMASLLYYARNTAGISFTLVSPINEPDTGGVEGPNMGSGQMVRVLHKLAVKLDGIGLSDIHFVAPEAAGDWTSFFNALVADPVVMAKLAYWGVHNYGSGAGSYQSTISGSAYPSKPFWVTETATFANMLGQIPGNPTANLVWDGFDSVYQHAIRAGRGSTPPNDSPGIEPPLIAYNTTTHLYTPRKGFYEHAQLFKFVAPGAVRIGATDNDANLTAYAYKHPTSGRLTIVARNASSSAMTVNGTLTNLPSAVSTLEVYLTNPTLDLNRATNVAVSGGRFSLSVPANTYFTLTSTSGPGVTITKPVNGAIFNAPALITLSAEFTGDVTLITNIEFFAGLTRIGAAATVPYSLVWPNVPVGNYTLTARANGSNSLNVTSLPVTITVTAAGGVAILGNSNEGSVTDTITDNTGAYINACRFQASADATVTGLQAKVGAITGRYQCAIYSDNNGNAGELLSATGTLTNVTDGWQTFALASGTSLTNGDYYWLAIWSDDVNARVYADTGGQERYAAYPFGTWPSPVNLPGSGAFTHCIYAPGTALSAYQQWKSNYGLAENIPNSSDDDQDGVPLLLEYAYGLDPLMSSAGGLLTGELQNNYLTVTYQKIKAATDITCTAQVAPDLAGPWLSGSNDVEQFWQVADGLTTQTITARDKTPVPNAARRFMRLQVTQR